jgi:hypothetical protein
MLNMTEVEKAEYLQLQYRDEEPIRDELLRLGFKRNNIRNLHTNYPDYSAAIDVIFSHLQKPHLDRVHEILGRLLAHPAAFRLWGDMVDIYQEVDKDSSPGLMDGLAIALQEHCNRSKSPELRNKIIQLLRDQSRGGSRMNLIDELSTDPDLKTEIDSWKRKHR